jgi:hypothetical protein
LAKKKSKKQLKRERQEAMERVRQEKGWTPPPQPDPHEQELLFDIMPLVSGVEEEDLSANPVANPLLEPVFMSDELVDEPEFDGIYFHPNQSVYTFIDIAEERGLDLGEFGNLPEEERSDVHLDMLAEMISRLLTEELGQEVVHALERLRQRARREGREKLVAQAATILTFLSEAPVDSRLWTSVGLVRGLAQRSLNAGFDVASTVGQMEEAGEIPDWMPGLAPDADEFAKTPAAKKVEAVLERYPGLDEFMAEENERLWEEGIEALFTGELYLELFTDEELESGFELFENTLGAVDGEVDSTSPRFLQAAEEFASGIQAYLTALFTPERTEELLDVLNELVQEQVLEAYWADFVMMFRDELAQSDPEQIVTYLSRAYLGELSATEAYDEEDEVEDEEAS